MDGRFMNAEENFDRIILIGVICFIILCVGLVVLKEIIRSIWTCRSQGPFLHFCVHEDKDHIRCAKCNIRWYAASRNASILSDGDPDSCLINWNRIISNRYGEWIFLVFQL